jgi:hypothetical protein
MRTHESESRGLGQAAKQVAEHASALVRLEGKLALLEVKQKVLALVLGIGLGISALVLLLFALGFALAGGAAGIATVLPTWAALLIVAGGLLLTAGALGTAALAALSRGAPPVPEQAIHEARATTEALRSNGRA